MGIINVALLSALGNIDIRRICSGVAQRRQLHELRRLIRANTVRLVDTWSISPTLRPVYDNSPIADRDDRQDDPDTSVVLSSEPDDHPAHTRHDNGTVLETPISPG
jgi:hypothetical protein